MVLKTIADIIPKNSKHEETKLMKRLICLATMVLLASATAFADIARPEPTKAPKPNTSKSIETGMTIRLDSYAKQARLIIPKSQIKELRAELEKLDDGSDNTAAVTAPGTFSRTQTIVSGSFLSLALVFGGMWFVRSGKSSKTGKGLVILAVATGIVSAATLVYANAGPPPEARSITGKMFTQAVHMYGTGWGIVKLEAGDQKQIELIVPDPKPSSTPSSEE